MQYQLLNPNQEFRREYVNNRKRDTLQDFYDLSNVSVLQGCQLPEIVLYANI